MSAATNVTCPPATLLSAEEQAWLDACPWGERRELTSGGRTFAVDRRNVGSSLPVVPTPHPSDVAMPPFYIGDVITNPTGTGGSGIAPMTLGGPADAPLDESNWASTREAVHAAFSLQPARLLAGHTHPRCNTTPPGWRA